MGTQQFDVVIVGAGFGGIGAAIQLNRLGYDDIVIVERENDLGGTWHVNHYPGLTVDVDKYNVRRYMRFNTTVEGARWGIFGWIRHMSTSKKVA